MEACFKVDVPATFGALCAPATAAALPPMRMWMHGGTSDIILFKEWFPTTAGAYTGAIIAGIATCLLVQPAVARHARARRGGVGVGGARQLLRPGVQRRGGGSQAQGEDGEGGAGGGAGGSCCGPRPPAAAPPPPCACCGGGADAAAPAGGNPI
jgi:hypothetical protein